MNRQLQNKYYTCLPKGMAFIIPVVFGMMFFVTVAYGQIQNGSFENGSNPDLSFWEGSCFDTQSYNNAPTGGGNWSIQVTSWSFPHVNCGKAFQKLPTITNGQTFILSGWAYSVMSPPNGTPTIGLYFGKINNGTITLQAGDTTSSASWAPLSVQSSFSLATGDTAVVVLYGGNVPQVATGYGYFDLINLQQVTGINLIEQKQSIEIFPNPFTNQTTLQTAFPLINATLIMNNIFGQTVAEMKNINGQTVTLQRNALPAGLYSIQLTEGNKQIVTQKIIITD